uniref:Opioid growth factor receptor like 1 n=1 Tax=Pundamilia nyererei TaxID=303518 RepID=A0A3B4GZ56_9CICH
MGNLVGSWRFKEPSTIEECDSTWGSDSESDEPAAEDDSGISDSVSPAESERLFSSSFFSGIYIEEILSKWRGDYDKLEHNHTYIQCLQEGTSLKCDKRRFLAAYSLMLDFYGVKLLDKSGNVARAPNWQERFQHLNESHHNYLRITRILKSLGELGYEAFKAPLVRFFLEESLCHGTLSNMQHSILEYFVYTIRLPATRRRLLRYARQHYRPAHAFLWGPPPKKRGGGAGAGGSVGAGSSGIRAPQGLPTHGRIGLKRRLHLCFGIINIRTMTGNNQSLEVSRATRNDHPDRTV